MSPMPVAECGCGSGFDYAACCGPLHAGATASDAVSLMRSRYCAYVLDLRSYLLGTWDPDTRPDALDPPEPALKWLGLRVQSSRVHGADAAEVTFEARYRVGGGRAVRLRETSRFRRHEDVWYYVDGVHGQAPGADPSSR